MSYMTFSGPNIKNLTHKELLDLIKFNEYYSGCFSVLQENNLKVIDILNLSENSIGAWKLPHWLIKKLVSLKEALTNNPESLFIQRENDDPRKLLAEATKTSFKNKPKPKLPSKNTTGGNSPTNKQSNIDLIYDEDNYLKAQFIGSIRKPINDTNREQPRLPNRKPQDLPFITPRKPEALPRPAEEENEYEPPPKHRSKFNETTTKLPLPPPPTEETDQYEPPPKFKGKQTESPQEEDYEYIEAKKEEKHGGHKSIFYVDTQNEFPPPLPERSFTAKFDTKKKKISNPPVYSNVDDTQSSTSPILNRNRKITPIASIPISPVSVDVKRNDSKTNSVLLRPLPPIPIAPEQQLAHRALPNAESENEDEEIEYQNTIDGINESDNLVDYGNLPETTSKKQNWNTGLNQNKPKDYIDDLRNHLSNFKPRLSNSLGPRKSSAEESRQLQEIFHKKNRNRENEVSNEAKSVGEIGLLKSKMRLPLPPTSLPQNVPTPYFDAVINNTGSASNDFGRSMDSAEDGENSDELTEYMNADAQTSEIKVKRNEHHIQPSSDLASKLKEVKLKTTPKNINLNDKLANELRRLLESRKGYGENSTTDSNVENSNPHQISSSSTWQSTFNTDNREDEDEIEQEEYDVPGSYNDMINFNNEPFYRNTDRKGAIALLKDLEDGAFLLRPSSKFFLSITIKNKGKYFNLGIEKTANNTIFCGEGMMRTKEFFSLQKLLQHFEIHPLTLQGERGLEEVYLRKVLPTHRF